MVREPSTYVVGVRALTDCAATSTVDHTRYILTDGKCCECNGKNAVCKNCNCVKSNSNCSSCYPLRQGRCSNIKIASSQSPDFSRNGTYSNIPFLNQDQPSNPNNNDGNNNTTLPVGSNNNLYLLDLINSHKRPVLNNIPKGARSHCLLAFNKILLDIIDDPNDLVKWSRYFLFSFHCMRKPVR